jgi:hypothetical protein
MVLLDVPTVVTCAFGKPLMGSYGIARTAFPRQAILVPEAQDHLMMMLLMAKTRIFLVPSHNV